MQKVNDMFLETLRKVVFRLQSSSEGRWYSHTKGYSQNIQNPNDILFREIIKGNPLMISRLGTSELHIILNFLSRDLNLPLRLKNYFNGTIPEFWWGAYAKNDIAQNSGFFPVDDHSLNQFVSVYEDSLPEIDILLSWLSGEKFLEERKLLNQKRTNLYIFDSEPFFIPKPWTKALEKKKVLVIHPFAESITFQYKKRTLLFQEELLPDFELTTMKAIQSIKGNSTEFKSWFDALDFMKSEIERRDFDIALIAAGAYGLPIAAHIKRMGKIGIHVGGVLQIYFGIRGSRWEKNESYKNLVNEHWKFPFESEYPFNYKKLDHGSYW